MRIEKETYVQRRTESHSTRHERTQLEWDILQRYDAATAADVG